MFNRLYAIATTTDKTDRGLIIFSVSIVLFFIIAGHFTRNGSTVSDLKKSNKILTDSVSVILQRLEVRDKSIEVRDKKIEELNKELFNLVKIAELKSNQYNEKKHEIEKIKSDFRRLNVDQRVRVFSNIISGADSI